MKRIVHLIASTLLLSVTATPAPGLTITTTFVTALRPAASSGFGLRLGAASTATRLKPDLHASRAAFAISTFDESTIKAFGTAWRRSGNGSAPREAVVLVLQMVGGGYSSREMGASNEHKCFTFRWHPATIAIIHTHPNTSDPRPQAEDINVADKYQVPIFTITSRGMYVYDPRSKKISKVMSNLDWLEISNWSKELFASQ